MNKDSYPGIHEYEDFLDQDIVVQMYNGQLLYGLLRSFDQFNNIALEKCVERVFQDGKYSEREIGLYMIRGENIVLLGLSHLDLSKYEHVEGFIEDI